MYEEDFEDYGPSKSQLKREADARQNVGISMIQLSKNDLESLELPISLYEAILLAQEMRNDSSLKRQKQLIGKLMRAFDDEDYARLSRRLEGLRSGSEQQKMIEKWVENKVERLLAADTSVNDEIVEQLDDLDFQYMRQMVRNSINEIKKGGKSRSRTLLFRYLRDKFEEKA